MKAQYTSKVNEHFDFELNQEQLQALDISVEEDGQFHILHEGQAYKAQLLKANPADKSFEFQINGRHYAVNLDDQYDQLVKQLGLSVVSSQQVNTITAPMPGLVLDVMVEPGQAIQKGDGLIILEAMKMENVIKSLGDGTVGSIAVEKGSAVDKGQLLIELA
ncbi:MAG: acetyl-CoA carboxylase biotin carboxyl carrier protein subunit [Bacteroidota bacterium]